MNPIIEDILLKKRLYAYTNRIIAERSGLPLSTVQKVLGGATKSPGVKTVEALKRAFPEEGYQPSREESLLREAPAYALQPVSPPVFYPYTNAPAGKYPRQGSYTISDYLALPDDQRVELIDGVFYDMDAPSVPHQLVGGEIFYRIKSFLHGKNATCVPLIAPTDVQLDQDEKTIMEPDVMVVCDRSIITRPRVFGAPDFVVEVLSPSTRNKDILIKTRKYRMAGVKEYWMVDMRHERVTKMLFEPPGEEEPEGDIITLVYSFDEPVPISLFKEELKINFREIHELYQFVYGNKCPWEKEEG